MASHPIASPAPAPAPSSPPTPPPVHFGKGASIGVGLIGGSLGMVLTHEQMADEIVGIGRRVENLKTAVALGAIHRYVTDSQEGIRDADLIVLATPVDTYERQVRAWRPWLHPGAIVTDVGSVKGALVERVEQLLPSGIRFVGAHPIAGREKTGVAAGSLTLFRQARCILTPTATTDAAALQQIRAMWEQAGSTVLTMDPHLHDRVLGAVSHLPHVVAFGLINALTEIQRRATPEVDLLTYGGGGLRDTTRIAGSSPEMWRDICVWNKDNLVDMLGDFEEQIRRLKHLIKNGDGVSIEREFERAKTVRERLR
ncbi:MAG: prephenate dehydrogenase/arogenate dehydrogenase family protein [Nitrospira sp.]|nr:MAG: prephenate dehydrogenase/arogenate dehydrogenase family protein [Nitrospira sp.]